jgi:hypothetical protein
LPAASDGQPASVGDLFADQVKTSLFVALASVVALLAAAAFSSVLPSGYAGAFGVFIGLAVIIFLAITLPCPHCGTRNLRF